jgi:NAD-dependent SIR2 family protein deacetylase
MSSLIPSHEKTDEASAGNAKSDEREDGADGVDGVDGVDESGRTYSKSEPAETSKVASLYARFQQALSSDASSQEREGGEGGAGQSNIEQWLASLNMNSSDISDPTPPPIRTDVFGEANTPASLSHVSTLLSSGAYKNILVLTGAGVSVAAGIPDFRTPGTGLYDNLEKYNLPHPTAVFDVDFYQDNPQPFVTLASEIWPGNHKPTLTHAFIKVLNDKNVLLRNYTQNIDGLEIIAGVDTERIIECHGHFRSASCCDCNKPADVNEVKRSMIRDNQVYNCTRCGGLTKPDIVFFGEDLPNYFHRNIKSDTAKADLLITIGTSLQVNPVASIPTFVGDNVPRVLFNRELVGDYLDGVNDYRDVVELGDCDESVLTFCDMLGWGREVREAYNSIEGRKEGDYFKIGPIEEDLPNLSKDSVKEGHGHARVDITKEDVD